MAASPGWPGYGGRSGLPLTVQFDAIAALLAGGRLDGTSSRPPPGVRLRRRVSSLH